MSDSLSWSVEIDRDSQNYNLHIDYFINGYTDPEDGEYFGDTTWSFTFARVPPGGAGSGGDGGFSSEAATITEGLLADFSPGLFHYRLDFKAWNTFSGDLHPLEASWDVFNAAFAAGPRTIIGTSTNDIVLGGSGDDLIRTFGGNDTIDGGGGDDIIDAGAGNDTIAGGTGNDIMIGGAGDDTYTVDAPGDLAVERAGEGFDTIIASFSFTLPDNVEQLLLLGLDKIDGTGNAGDNQISGNSVANKLYGLDGNDILTGNGGDDMLFGGGGNDTLDGGTGNDRMDGGAGNDTFRVDSQLDRVIEAPGGGNDTIITTFLRTYTLPAQVENLQAILLPGVAFHGIGNGLNNVIEGTASNDVLEGGAGNDDLVGNDGDDTLIGGPGADALRGGNGIDTASYATSGAAVTVSLGTGKGVGGDAQGDGLLGVENLIGSDGDDTLTGNAIANRLSGGPGADVIAGGGGNDTILGGPGADTLDGGPGIDTLSYAGSAGAVTVDLAQQLGTATGGDAQGDEISNFERLVGGAGGDTLTGDDGDNAILGGMGDDTINGAGGNDLIVGGAGADALDGGLGNDMVSYMGSTGGVIVNLALQTVLGGDATGDTIAGFENAQGGNGDDSLTGSATANALWGGAGNDIIVGGEGNDTINGGPGADKMEGGDGVDTLSYAGSTVGVSVNLVDETVAGGDAAGDTISGFENVVGSDSSDFILGNDGNNVLSGGGGPDFLDGRGGNDLLIGGDLADTFVFGTGYGHDTIKDFTPGLSPDESIMLLLGPAFDTFSAIMAVAQASGPSLQNTVFRFDANTSLTLDGVKPAQLTANDFQFV